MSTFEGCVEVQDNLEERILREFLKALRRKAEADEGFLGSQAISEIEEVH
jgi:hypothetical protein